MGWAGVHELKIRFGPGFRIYYGEDGPRLVILLCGGDKSSQGRDIENAHAYWSDYQREYVEPSVSYNDELIKDLKNPAGGVRLSEFRFGGRRSGTVFSGAAECGRGSRGLLKLSRRIKMHRGNLYRMLSKKGNPEIQALRKCWPPAACGSPSKIQSRKKSRMSSENARM